MRIGPETKGLVYAVIEYDKNTEYCVNIKRSDVYRFDSFLSAGVIIDIYDKSIKSLDSGLIKRVRYTTHNDPLLDGGLLFRYATWTDRDRSKDFNFSKFWDNKAGQMGHDIRLDVVELDGLEIKEIEAEMVKQKLQWLRRPLRIDTRREESRYDVSTPEEVKRYHYAVTPPFSPLSLTPKPPTPDCDSDCLCDSEDSQPGYVHISTPLGEQEGQELQPVRRRRFFPEDFGK